MLKTSQNNEKKLFDLEKRLGEETEAQPQAEKELGFEEEKTESSQTSTEKEEPVIAPLSTTPNSPTPVLQTKEDKIFKDIESILSEDIEEIYKNLPETLQEDFKKKGEETAKEIKGIISQARIAISKVLTLIKNWLLMVPGVNKFFLEQESKIKTEKILNLAEKIKNEQIE